MADYVVSLRKEIKDNLTRQGMAKYKGLRPGPQQEMTGRKGRKGTSISF